MKFIYKFYLSVAVIVITANVSIAQTYSITPNDTINVTGIMEDLATLTIQQLNISNYTLTLEWQKVSESVPLNWETNVCDNVICYTSLVNSGTMNPVSPGAFGFLLVHVTPHVNIGTATIRYAVWDALQPLQKDTLTYILTVNSPSGIMEDESLFQVSLSPNPASESISIKNEALISFSYTISDASGKLVDSGFSNSELIAINTEFYKSGVYYLSLSKENGSVKRVKFIILHKQ